MSTFHIALSAIIHEAVEFGERLFGYPRTKVVAPAPDHWVHLTDQGGSGGPHMLAPEPFELPLQLVDGVCARFDQQLVTTARAIGS